MKRSISVLVLLLIVATFGTTLATEPVKIGMNYPASGPYSIQGKDQYQAAQLAVSEINASGGILGEQVELVYRDSKSQKDLSTKNVTELIDAEGVKMVFGGSSSSVAIAAGKVCQAKGVPFFGTLTYSNATTGKEALRHSFRECNNSWMAAKALSSYLEQNFSGKKYFYVTADYTWGYSTEASMRAFTGTEDAKAHKGVKTPFPGATDANFKKALSVAKAVKPDVLVLVLFGKDMSTAVRQATAMGLKNSMQIVVPNLTLGMAEGGGAKVMEGVVGTVPWCWQVPYQYDYAKGQEFVEAYSSLYKRYPSTSGASAYTIMWEYKNAVERAGSFDSAAIIKSLEGHEYTLLKDKQVWRDFDHQSVQTIYAVKCKAAAEVSKDQFKLDYFEILSALPGDQAVRSRAEWEAVRSAAGKPLQLEALPGEVN